MEGIQRLPDFLGKVRDCTLLLQKRVLVTPEDLSGTGLDVFKLDADGSRTGLIIQRVSAGTKAPNGDFNWAAACCVAFGRVPAATRFYDPSSLGGGTSRPDTFPQPSGSGIMLDEVTFLPHYFSRMNAPIQETVYIRNLDPINAVYVHVMEFRGGEVSIARPA